MASQAAIDGTRDNGLSWRARIGLAGHTSRLAQPENLTEDDLSEIRDAIARRVRAFLASPEMNKLHAGARGYLEEDVETLEDCAPDVDELRAALSDLYDEFDYWRICVVT
jgi:hypothetical protein